MQLFADRFAIDADGAAVDLATGESVAITTSIVGGDSEQIQWMRRCDRLFRLRRPGMARLVDYGRVGECHRFEAWCAGSPLPAVDAAGAGAQHLIDCVCVVEGGEEIEALSEAFDATSRTQTALAIWSRDRVRLEVALAELCRAARLSGRVPIAPAKLAQPIPEAARDRAWTLIGDDPDAHRQTALEWTLMNPRAHVLLFATSTEVRGASGIGLAKPSVDRLIASILPHELSPRLGARVRAAAERARGSYERFCGGLWPRVEYGGAPAPLRQARRVAERAADYGARLGQAGHDGTRVGEAAHAVAALETHEWPAPGELATLGRKLDAAVATLERGLWASGERALRQAIGSLERRRDWAAAARGLMGLAEARVVRGRPAEALEILAEARVHWNRDPARSGSDGALARMAVIAGTAWTDLAELEKGAAVLQTALFAPASGGATLLARLALGRCLFWQGRFDEARRILLDVEFSDAADALRIRARAQSSRALAGLDDAAGAVAIAASAFDAARALGAAPVVAEAAHCLAVAHLLVGDHAAVERDVAACVGAARAAHDPLRALKARLLQAESARRAGKAAFVGAFLNRVRTLGAGRLPPLVRAQLDLLRDQSHSGDGTAVKRRVAATGIHGLTVLAPRADRGGDGVLPPAVADTVDILQRCQSAQDEQAVLAEVCAAVKARLGAAAVAFIALQPPPRGAEVVACDGRVEAGFGRRVLDARQVIVPQEINGRVEGGAPIRYGGDMIGALACRWTLAAPCDPGKSAAVLTLAAAAAGPAVAAMVLARRATAAEDDGILGESPAMQAVRRAVDRAAAAPFSVLIQGESGSGKELIARALHRRGARRHRAFCTLNCAALPEDLIESELFGHARGAFTGAVAERAGVFEEAHGGTLFLDEVGELSPRAQAKLLRAIQEGEIRRVGENIARRVDVRIVAATNRDLKQECTADRFRMDLLYRLDVVRLVVPPLRDRRDDIVALVDRYWREACARVGSKATLGSAAMAALARYDWPGNVRELQNVLASLSVSAARRGIVPPTALPPVFTAGRTDGSLRLEAARRTFEERFVRSALARSGGHRARAAAELGLSRQGLTKLMARLGITER